MQTTPPQVRLTDADRHKPLYVAYRCQKCRRDFDTSLNPTPKKVCRFCGSGRWEKVKVLTLKEAYDLYAQTGVLFLNHDTPEHVRLHKWLAKHSRITALLDNKQRAGVLSKWPYVLIRKILKEV